MRSNHLLTVVLLTAFTLGGCAKQRPLPLVRDQGAKAYERQQYDIALKDYTEAVDRDPGDYRGQVGLAKVYMAIDRPEKAREHLEVARTTRPNDRDILELLCESLVESEDYDALHILLKNDAEQRKTVGSYLRYGRYMARAGDIDTAERALITAARLDKGQSIDVQMTLADFYEGLGDDTRALRRLRMALYLDPANPFILERIRTFGEVPGPSLALQPDEAG